MRNQKNTAILFINLGTPEKLSKGSIRTYLKEFLMDERVIDLPFFLRFFIVYVFILPFRPKKTLHKYEVIWDKNNDKSPIILNTERFINKLKSKLSDYYIDFAMRYGKPGIKDKMDQFYNLGIRYLHIIPLYPQYASSTYGTVIAEVCRINQKYWDPFIISFEPIINNEEKFIQIWSNKIKSLNDYQNYHVIFSFHGIPERHIKKSDRLKICLTNHCCEKVPEYCYKAQCYDISKNIAKVLELSSFSVAFQSRLGKAKWIEPYLEEHIKTIIKDHKNILIVPLSFTSDCLETLEELKFSLVNQYSSDQIYIHVMDSLNDDNEWVDFWYERIKKYL